MGRVVWMGISLCLLTMFYCVLALTVIEVYGKLEYTCNLDTHNQVKVLAVVMPVGRHH